MTKTLKNKWIKALESGKYKKGRGALKLYNKYCCLGVLADICGLRIDNTIKLEEKEDLLCPAVLNKIGLTNNEQRTLVVLNDNTPTFSMKVVPWIKKNL